MKIDSDQCEDIRERVEQETTQKIADDLGVSVYTIRVHAFGRCAHGGKKSNRTVTRKQCKRMREVLTGKCSAKEARDTLAAEDINYSVDTIRNHGYGHCSHYFNGDEATYNVMSDHQSTMI